MRTPVSINVTAALPKNVCDGGSEMFIRVRIVEWGKDVDMLMDTDSIRMIKDCGKNRTITLDTGVEFITRETFESLFKRLGEAENV